MTVTREFQVVRFDFTTMTSPLIASLRIEGTDAADCWTQAEKWRDENAERGDVVRGIFMDPATYPEIHIRRA